MQNPVDQSIFTGQNIVVVAYVDDIIIFNKNAETVNKLKTHISKHVDIIDLNNTKFYLNMKIICEKKTIILIQRKFVKKLFKKFASQTKSFKNLCIMKIKLKTNPNMTISKKIKKFQQQIESLMYLITCTKFDLCYSINALTRFMSNSESMHFKALNQI